jgi:DNA-binding transcriptional LysR family regulator
VVDVAGDGFDCALRVGEMPDSSLVGVRMADNRRPCVVSPAYLQRHGAPQHPTDPAQFACLTLSSDASQTRSQAFQVGGDVIHLQPGGPLDCSDGQVLHDWCLDGYSIAKRSTWEVESDIAAGRLVTVLDDYAAPPNGIYALCPQCKHLALRVRLWIDVPKHHHGQADDWRQAQAWAT